MPKFAEYNKKVPDPSPVIGWYDTDIFDYPSLPPTDRLVKLTEDQWAAHFEDPNGFDIVKGALARKE